MLTSILLACVLGADPTAFIDLSADTKRQTIVDREPGKYLGHVSTVTLSDGKTILAAYPQGHGSGPIILKKSVDGGRSWSERLPTPDSFATSKETPTLHRLKSPVDGIDRVIMFSSLFPMRSAFADAMATRWSELKIVGNWGGIVGMGDVVTLRDGTHVAFFHDDGRFFAPRPVNTGVFTLYATRSADGGLSWSDPWVVHASKDLHLCEPGAIWSPSGDRLALLLRENSRRSESHVMFSTSEGRSFSRPVALHPNLTGDRHTVRYTKDGRLVVCFRDMSDKSPHKGDFVAWVGTFDDIINQSAGQYRVRLADNTNSWDCGYPGVEVLEDGSILATTYGYWDEGESPYIKCFRFNVEELDRFAASGDHQDPVASFGAWLNDQDRASLDTHAWSNAPLSAEQASQAIALVKNHHRQTIRTTRAEEWRHKLITLGDLKMKFDFKEFGEIPKEGRALYISMHGGGSAPPEVNEQQWRNQIGLYKPAEGIYLSPRAPTDSWNMWHQGHMDDFFTRLIEDAVVFANVNPDRVYLMGYSAGGDGVYQVAPRMPDRFAAASMMAGHPNEAQPDGLRNLPFTIHMGANDDAFNRNGIARAWGETLAQRRAQDPDGYEHSVTLHEGMGHWMKLKDSVAVAWMAQYSRRTHPQRIVWLQDDVTHPRSYWLGVPESDRKAGTRIVASHDKNTFTIESASGVNDVILWLDDAFVDLSKPITVKLPDGSTVEKNPQRSIRDIFDSFSIRPDFARTFSAKLQVKIPAPN